MKNIAINLDLSDPEHVKRLAFNFEAYAQGRTVEAIVVDNEGIELHLSGRCAFRIESEKIAIVFQFPEHVQALDTGKVM